MLGNDLHRLLKRQLKKSGLNIADHPVYAEFLGMIDRAYKSFDADFSRIENILEESSKELFKANQLLKLESASTKIKLENILNSVQGVLFEADIDGKLIYLNKAWEEIIGLKIKDSLGKNYQEIFTGKNKDQVASLKKSLKPNQEYFKTLLEFHDANSNIKWLEINLALTKDANGNRKGTIGTITDVTSLKETEIKLHVANKAKDDFLSTISHEIRTPLNAVVGLSNILNMEEHLPNQIENLEALKYSSEHLLGLIDDILEINQIEATQLQLEKCKFNLLDFLRTIKYHFKLIASEKKLDFRIEKDINVPNFLVGDTLRLSQILKNLLSNAFKFTEEGSVILHVEYLGEKNGLYKLGFKVSDTGIGIPYDKQHQIFEKFTQATKDTKRLYGGTGLGLSISKELLKLKGSELQVVSEPGEGSTFWFELDFEEATSNINTSKEKTEQLPLNLNVLIAEDNSINVLVLKKMLEKWQVHYTVVSNGKEAIKAVEDHQFDLILMDLQMPILDGYQATNSIRDLKDKVKASTPIVALSAFSQTEIKEKTKSYKMDGYMTKPFNPNELYSLLMFYSTKNAKRLIV